MKKILIISPHFPPVNAADMHRVRQSLPYFRVMGWEPVVVVVEPVYVETVQDPLLLETVPIDVEVIQVKAFSTKFTRRLGLGSLALRSLWFYYREVSKLLKKRKFDLVYFSTTMFPLPILGRIWKSKSGIPYVIDMQDPWHTDYYLSKPKEERPPKYWFSYRLNRLAEPFAMKKVDGIISVSEAYNVTLQNRYANITPDQCITLTFGAFEKDFEVIGQNKLHNPYFDITDGMIHIPYIGAVGHIMDFSINCIMLALKKGLQENYGLFNKVRLYFIGTSYAAKGKGKQTVLPIAKKYGLENHVLESTTRVPYFQVLKILQDASMLVIPGSDDPDYTASKLYNYILARKKMLALFHEKSSVVKILADTRAGQAITFQNTSTVDTISDDFVNTWQSILKQSSQIDTDWQVFRRYNAQEMTRRQVEFFDSILKKL